jgi:hypothetical protein
MWAADGSFLPLDSHQWARAPSISMLHYHTETHHTSVRLLRRSDRPVAEMSIWQHTALTRDRHPGPRRNSNPQYQQASGRRPTPYAARPVGSAGEGLHNKMHHSGSNTHKQQLWFISRSQWPRDLSRGCAAARLLVGTAGSNTAGGMDICFSGVLYITR